jgi:hypothetical protein
VLVTAEAVRSSPKKGVAMARSIEVTVRPSDTQDLLDALRSIPGVAGVRVQRQGSLLPPGDVVGITSTNEGFIAIMGLLHARGVGTDEHSLIQTSEPTSVVAAPLRSRLAWSRSDASWEEMEATHNKQGSMTVNALVLMAAAGSLATVGMVNGTLHYVIAAMLLAPGFEPFTRVALGIVARSDAWRYGLVDTFKGYGVLVVAALFTALLMAYAGKPLPDPSGTYLAGSVLVAFWSTLTASGVWVSGVASVVGAILIATQRAVLTAGVMIALALVPAAALVGLGIASGDYELALRGVVRWLVEVGLVTTLSLVMLAWKRSSVQKRDALA